MPEHTPYQRKVIERYYDHRDSIMLNKLSELVSELYLAQTDKKRDQLWTRVDKAMRQLKIKDAVREHIMNARNVETLADHLRDWTKSLQPGGGR